jgi:hypothetical protein
MNRVARMGAIPNDMAPAQDVAGPCINEGKIRRAALAFHLNRPLSLGHSSKMPKGEVTFQLNIAFTSSR